MVAKLNDKRKKQVAVDRVEGMTIRQLAKKYNVSTTTIQRALKYDTEVTQIVTKKKEQNTADVLGYMEEKKEKVCGIIDKTLDILDDADKLKKSSPQALATAMGILIDKFVCTPLEAEKVKAQTASLRGEDAHSQQQEDDPITKSLKEQFKEI